MDHLLEISRIVDGAVKGDPAKVLAYVEQLARKLRALGENAAADRLMRTAEKKKSSEVVAAGGLATTLQLPVDNESRLALADEEWVDTESVTVVLDAALENKVEEFVRYVKAADRLLANNVGLSPSMLIYGPPGVGKTELGRYIAAQLQLPLVTARSDSLISSFLGSTAKNLRILFEHASSRPCVLFLDELDSVAKLRDDHHELGELKRVVVSLLQNIDASCDHIVLLGATNHHHLLDPAIWRRFAYKLEMGLPGIQDRKRLFEHFSGDYLPSTMESEDFASLSEGSSGADIRHICESAIRAAILDERSAIDATNVFRGIVQHRLGSTVDFTTTESSFVHAVHDLGPKVFTMKRLAALFNSSEPTISRRLKQRDNHGRKRSKTPNQDRSSKG